MKLLAKKNLVQKSKYSAAPRQSPRQQFLALRGAVRHLSRLKLTRARRQPTAVQAEQPFDGLLYAISPLYRQSRKRYLEVGGRFRSLLVSSPRTLSSPTLLEPIIQYSPLETEMIWASTDPAESGNEHHLLTLRTYVGSLFHEQNHRSLWTLLPPPPRDVTGIHRYLNFAESLVITSDMALGDELGTELARKFYLTGTIYDPGTDVRRSKLSRRDYRNYLQAAMHATYLNLEFYDPADIERGISALFPGIGKLAQRASRRSGNLDRAFVWKTNPAWQKKQGGKVYQTLTKRRNLKREQPLLLSDDPMDNRLQYLFAEKWFEALGL